MEGLCGARSGIGRLFAFYLLKENAPYESQGLRHVACPQQKEGAGLKIRHSKRNRHIDNFQTKMLPCLKACLQRAALRAIEYEIQSME